MILFLSETENIGHVIGVENSGRRHDFLAQFRKTFGEDFEPVLYIEPGIHVQLLLQQMAGRPFPAALQAQNLNGPFYEKQFHRPTEAVKPDVIILSIEPDLCSPLWQHKTEGFFFYPEPDWEQQWSLERQSWLREEFDPSGLITLEKYEGDLLALAREIRARWGAAVLFLNGSTLDPDDGLFTYRGREDSLPVRVNRFNLALLRASIQEGISIIDVDRMVAEVGNSHILDALRYSDSIYKRIGQELVRVINDLGLNDGNQPIYRLDMPYVDLQVKEGVISAWHKKVGEPVKVGDPLVDLEVQFMKLKRTHSAHYLSKKKTKKVGGKVERLLVRLISAANGNLSQIYTHPGSIVKEGTLMAAITADNLDLAENPELDVMTAAKFRVSTKKLNIGKEL